MQHPCGCLGRKTAPSYMSLVTMVDVCSMYLNSKSLSHLQDFFFLIMLQKGEFQVDIALRDTMLF